MEGKEVSVHEIRPGRDRLAQIRRIMGRALRSALTQQGNELAGFALVTWDNRGDATSAFYTETGPIGDSLLPTFVGDVLNRHQAVLTAQSQQTHLIPGDM